MPPLPSPKATSKRKGQKKAPLPTITKATPESEDSDPDMPNMNCAPTKAGLHERPLVNYASDKKEAEAPKSFVYGLGQLPGDQHHLP
ncbi:hypothetical protein K438DRAFT_1982424 [Mycena galopus ATCC 62051]|nr:hypothetical protein K438DRAFT_1982424 [Mycena galopus ATCC 62051]